jgi:hypothetical protein
MLTPICNATAALHQLVQTEKRRSSIKKILTTSLVCLMVVASVFGSQEQRKRITVDHFKNEPVEIVRIRIDGRTLTPNDNQIEATSDWPVKVEITVKNTSELPVSYILVEALEKEEDSILSVSAYKFGISAEKGLQSELLEPGKTAVLKYKYTSALRPSRPSGSLTPSRPIIVHVVEVFWNNDQVGCG